MVSVFCEQNVIWYMTTYMCVCLLLLSILWESNSSLLCVVVVVYHCCVLFHCAHTPLLIQSTTEVTSNEISGIFLMVNMFTHLLGYIPRSRIAES
jgi:hypothetical protein